MLCLDYRRYVLYLKAILSEVEVIWSVEVAATVNALVRNEIREAPKDVAANFALINQVALSRQQFTQLWEKEKSIFGIDTEDKLTAVLTSLVPASYALRTSSKPVTEVAMGWRIRLKSRFGGCWLLSSLSVSLFEWLFFPFVLFILAIAYFVVFYRKPARSTKAKVVGLEWEAQNFACKFVGREQKKTRFGSFFLFTALQAHIFMV